jgi:signal transduction histidine kinase
MQTQFDYIILVYFLYGLAFFSMGLLVAIEGGRAPDLRLRKALRPLAGFGLIHGLHEWVDMLDQMEKMVGRTDTIVPDPVRLAVLAFSFISLMAFGSYLLANSETSQRLVMLIPLSMEGVWVFGLLVFQGRYAGSDLWAVAEVWTRYTLAIPASLMAAIGLIAQQRAFRRSGLVRFGQDSLWAAVSFAWYGVIGQIFVRVSPLPPSDVVNAVLFENLFGFPIQLLRALSAIAAAFFVVRFLRAFQVETDRKIADLQEAQLKESRKRESLRGELYRRVVAAQESERQRIARDLHDATGQSLTAIGMGLRGLSTTILTNKDPKQSVLTLRQLESMSTDALEELQRLIADLRPSHLDDLGLPATIRWYAGQIQDRTNLKIKVEVTGEERSISSTVKIAMFRIVQEALNNIIKHANATNVRIHIYCEEKEMLVAVEDDGSGFNTQQVNSAQARRQPLGLVGMQERAALLGGNVHIHSEPGMGTLIEVEIPYVEKDSEVSDGDAPATGG